MHFETEINILNRRKCKTSTQEVTTWGLKIFIVLDGVIVFNPIRNV